MGKMLFGEFHQQVDEKGRVRIPAKLKTTLSDGVTIAKGTSGCLFIFSSSELQNIADKIKSIPLGDLEIQRSLRMFTAGISDLEEDNQGRCLLPRNLREFAEIKKDIVFTGVGNRIELWAKEVYDAYMSGETVKKSINYDKLFAELNKYGV